MGKILNTILGYLIDVFIGLHDIVSKIVTSQNISVGLTIILFVIIVKLVLLPLNIQQIRSTLKISKVQPHIKKIQDMHKKDPKKLQEETMKLYKEHGANPMGGCLPVLLQWPILIAMFYVFQSQYTPMKDLLEAGFLFIPKLSASAHSSIWGISLALLSGATTYLNSVISMKGTAQQPGTPNMKVMNISMTVMMVFVGWNLSTAINLYYVVSNTFQVLQTYLVRKAFHAEERLKEKQV